ncbi:MAG: hypothetical protein IKM98_07695 [Bacteroidales bacterium]|nr:hypothetical protein [Bacteroidales bacterium]
MFLTNWNLDDSVYSSHNKAAVMPIGYVKLYLYVFAYGYLCIIRGLSALLVSDYWARPKPQFVGRVTK